MDFESPSESTKDVTAAGSHEGVARGAGVSDANGTESKGNGGAPSHRPTNGASRKGMTVQRLLTRPGIHPFDEITWELRTATIGNERGEVVFEQAGIEIPSFWSQMATNVVASKYFNGPIGTPRRESSVKQLVGRVVNSISRWGREQGYFATEADADAFEAELAHLLVYQKAAFNSPVWFNVGIEEKPQCSACFINSVSDKMESILELAKTEGMLFKWGSGSGTNFSALRSSKERLSSGGTASGPVSFMKGYDAFAGVIKSGGKTRRAAKMVILNVDHPDIEEYIHCKAEEEKKAWTLIDGGYDGSFTGPAYASVFFQNSNNSVRVTDEFMRAVEENADWTTRAVTNHEPVESMPARRLFRGMADAAWICGDPGIQYHSTINDWHTCPNTGPINASNPCSEYMFLDDTACNLASLNLMKFRNGQGDLDAETFRHAVRILILAQEIIVDAASYPTAQIGRNSHDYRPLGLGYANLGTYLMARGIPYDSERGRQVAAAITAIMTGQAYATSAEIAAGIGPFPGFEANREPMLRVMGKHRAAAAKIDATFVPERLAAAARRVWEEAEELGHKHGYRNSQVTVLAPTGTIAFMMDCDTTGIEPDIALIKYKKLVGGGMLKIVNQTVPEALEFLGYTPEQRRDILLYLEEQETIEGAPHLKAEHLSIFDCAFKPRRGNRSIHYMGHVRMMGATQPFLSGAISKTVNMPKDATVEEIEQVYREAWKLGLKAVAIYRDGCKRTQPLNTSRDPEPTNAELPSTGTTQAGTAQAGTALVAAAAESPLPAPQRTDVGPWAKAPVYGSRPNSEPMRRRLPDERRSITHKFSIGGHEGYITVGLYEDNTPGEIFVVMAKEGSVVSGLVDSFATSISIALQYGVPLKVLADKFSHVRFEPSGITTNPDIRFAKSITDYIFRWLALKFLPDHDSVRGRTVTDPYGLSAPVAQPVGSAQVGSAPVEPLPVADAIAPPTAPPAVGAATSVGTAEAQDGTYELETDSPSCPECGSLMVRNAACYRCLNCGTTNGCS
ncbi:MAG: vitamin B12-dependent ribonucleotide reductase [Candidatus Eisenbacteria bacterium]|nr:vitamin B12-dependent ribonucleotide reductase [Candidatus Eisenbacteria bacterium]